MPNLRRDIGRRPALSKTAGAIARAIAGAIWGAAGALLMLVVAVRGEAAAADATAGLKVPRFVSLHADRVNLRAGPGRQFPIEWVLTKKDMPVEIIAQFEHWRRIRGWDGTVGWVQERMLTGRRNVVVGQGGDRPLHKQPDPASAVIARTEPGIVARLVECRGLMCRIEVDGFSGWMLRADLWGVYPDETVP